MSAQFKPVAWRWRYTYQGEPSHWRVRQTPTEPHPETAELAALEVEPLYPPVAGELYEALDRLLERHGDYINDLPGETGVSDLAFAKAALAKARGEQ